MEEAALEGGEGAGPVRVGVVERLGVPAPVVGEAGDALAALGDQVPEVFGRLDPAGVLAAHADDREGFAEPFLGLAEAAARLPEVCGRPSQVVENLLIFRHQRHLLA